ncbi:MAG: GNAT family N-acetyltransferase [Vulcanimicrobiota bacterium]
MIESHRLRLRPIRKEDIDKWLIWLNDEEVMKYLSVYGVNRMQEESFFETMTKSNNEKVFTIETKEGEPVGVTGLHKIHWEWRNAELGIIIGEKKHWNKGFCTEAMRLMVEIGFNRMNLNSIYLRVCEFNQHAVKCYEKAGFVIEGRLRQHHYFNGRYSDEIFMSIIKEDFERQGDN